MGKVALMLLLLDLATCASIPRKDSKECLLPTSGISNVEAGFLRVVFRLASAILLFSSPSIVRAQSNDLLYDPEPPVDSAYVRVIHVSRTGLVDVLVDGQLHMHNMGSGEASDYMVLPAGKHTLALHSTVTAAAQVAAVVDVDKGQAITVAFPLLQPEMKPLIFVDKTNSNKLKVLLSAYHLHPKLGPLDVLTVDGKNKVFTNLAFGASGQIAVNPIAVELMAVKSADKAVLAKSKITMESGSVFSILLLPGEGEKLLIKVVQNKVERYTGNR